MNPILSHAAPFRSESFRHSLKPPPPNSITSHSTSFSLGLLLGNPRSSPGAALIRPSVPSACARLNLRMRRKRLHGVHMTGLSAVRSVPSPAGFTDYPQSCFCHIIKRMCKKQNGEKKDMVASCDVDEAGCWWNSTARWSIDYLGIYIHISYINVFICVVTHTHTHEQTKITIIRESLVVLLLPVGPGFDFLLDLKTILSDPIQLRSWVFTCNRIKTSNRGIWLVQKCCL